MTEAYCLKCRRMVPADPLKVPGLWRLIDHYRFDLSHNGGAVLCTGKVSASKITHGMEDPQAAFRYASRAWGMIGRTVSEGRYADYVD